MAERKSFLLRIDADLWTELEAWAQDDLRSVNGQVEYLLRQEGIRRIVLLGQVTEQCILYSALDAYVRHFEVVVAPDAVAHIHEDLARAALRMMEINMRARLVEANQLAFG